MERVSQIILRNRGQFETGDLLMFNPPPGALVQELASNERRIFAWSQQFSDHRWFHRLEAAGCTAGFGALLAELFPTSIRNTAMGTVYNVSRSFQVVTQWLMAVIAVGSGVSSGLLLAAVFALITATWVWTLPETRGIALHSD